MRPGTTVSIFALAFAGADVVDLLPVFPRQRCWGGSSVGRALRSQRRGREFESHPLHQFLRRRRRGSSLQPAEASSPGGRRHSVRPGSEQGPKERRPAEPERLCIWKRANPPRAARTSRVRSNGVSGKCPRRRPTRQRRSAARSRRPGRSSPRAHANAIWRAASPGSASATCAAWRFSPRRSRSASRSCSPLERPASKPSTSGLEEKTHVKSHQCAGFA